MTMTEAPQFSFSLGITRRDLACFIIALVAHSLLFLWKGGMLMPVEDASKSLGDMIVQVGYISEVPGGGYPGADTKPGTGPGSILSRVKSFFTKPAPAPEANTGGQLAVGAVPQALESKPNWTKTEQTGLSNRAFSERKEFKGTDAEAGMNVSKGETDQVLSAPSAQGNFKTEGTALKEKSYQQGLKESPFKVVQAKSFDTLSNSNAIPVDTSGSSSGQVAAPAVIGSDAVGPSMKSKELTVGSLGSSGGFGSKGNGTGGAGGAGDTSGMLAMGGGNGTGGPVTVGGTGGNGAGGTGTDTGSYGTGSGSGYGGGGGSGVGGFGSGSGSKSWGGGTGLGGTQMQTLPRGTVSDQPAGKNSGGRSGDKDFIITGALAGRGITTKVKPKYEAGFDGRVALKFAVDFNGRVLDGIVVVLSSGNPTFDQKVIASLKKWVFVPLEGNRTNEIQEGVITFIFRGV